MYTGTYHHNCRTFVTSIEINKQTIQTTQKQNKNKQANHQTNKQKQILNKETNKNNNNDKNETQF